MALGSDVALAASVDLQVQVGSPANAMQLRFSRVAADEFDRSSSAFDDSCQEQLFSYARRRWGKTQIEPVLFWRGDELVGGTLVMLQPMPVGLGTVAVVKWGPMLKHGRRADRDAIYLAMIETLITEYAVKRGMVISVMPKAAPEPNNRHFEMLKRRGFKVSAGLAYPNRYLVALRADDAALRRSFAQKWRYHLGKSEKAGLTFEPAGPERLDEYTALQHAMSERKDFADHAAYDTVPALMATDVDALRPELFFVRHAGEIVAGAVIYKAGDTAVYLYGATNDKALPLRAGYFLHWNIIRWLRDHTRADWYDLGGSGGFLGLHQFKKGMVGSLGTINPVPPIMLYAAQPAPLLIGRFAFAARELAAKLVRLGERFRHRAKPDQVRPAAETD